MSILSSKELKKRLDVQLPSSRQLNSERVEKQRINTKAIFDLERNGLQHGSFERRMLVYSTILNEKIFMEYPGKESIGNAPMPKDTCPGFACDNNMIELDTSFGDIWDVMDLIGRRHQADLPLLATVLIRMANMIDYKKKNLSREACDIVIEGTEKTYDIATPINMELYQIEFHKRTWETLNDKFSGISIKGQEMSFEAFIKYFDVLLMNEDSKYAYKSCAFEGCSYTYETWNYKQGRVNTIGTCLNVIGYLENKIRISELLDGFQKGRGTMKFSIPKYSSITDDLVKQ